MASVSKNAHTAVATVLGLLAVVAVCVTLQSVAPNRTVKPIATKFLCNGSAVSVDTQSGAREESVLDAVYCLNGIKPDDVTTMDFFILTIPCALAVAAISVLGRRLIAPRPKTRVQRAALN